MSEVKADWRKLGALVALALAWVGWQQLTWGFGAWGWADWNDFMASGWAAARGLNPYAASHGPNMNPPALLPLFAALWAVPWDWSLGIAKICAAVSFAGALAVAGVRLRWWMVVGLALFASTSEAIFQGQVYGEVALCAAVIWRLLPRSSMGAGLLLGLLVAVKPNFGIAGIMLLGPGAASVIAWSAAGFALANVPPLVIWGPQVFVEWWHLASTTAGYINQVNGTFAPMAVAFGWGRLWAPAALGVAAVNWWWCHCTKATMQQRFTLGIGLGIVLAPVTWIGYGVILIPLVLAQSKRPGWVLGGACALALPLVPVFPFIYDLWITISNPLAMVWLTLCAVAQAGGLDRTRAATSVAGVARASARRHKLGVVT